MVAPRIAPGARAGGERRSSHIRKLHGDNYGQSTGRVNGNSRDVKAKTTRALVRMLHIDVSMIFFGFIFETQHTRHRCHRTTTRQILHTLASPPNILSHPGPTLNSSHFSSTKGRHLSFIAMMAIRTGSYLCAAARASTLVGSTWSSAEARTRSEALPRL